MIALLLSCRKFDGAVCGQIPLCRHEVAPKQNMNELALRANNLANANTDGFKSDMAQARSMQAFGEGLPTRVFAMTESPSANFRSGPIKRLDGISMLPLKATAGLPCRRRWQ